MGIQFSNEVLLDLKKIKRKDKKLITLIHKKLKLFRSDPKHPSLRTHKLSGKLQNRMSLSINKSVRMVYVLLDNDIVYFVDIGTHNEVYKK